MSYILDALRRSQAERDRGQVPGLNTQAAPALPLPSPAQRPASLWAGVALAVLAVLGLCWLWLRPAPQPAAAMPSAPVAPVQRVQAPPTPPALQQAMPAVPAPPLASPPAAPTSLPQVVSAPPLPAPVTAGAVPTAAAPALPAATVAATPPPTSEVRPVPLSQLGAQQRQELPPMSFGGSIWSDSAANRFVIVNGQVVREGEQAAPGVTLERIGPKAAILRWRDLRIEVPF